MKGRGAWQLKGRAGIILLVMLGLSAASGVAFLRAKGAPQQAAAPAAAPTQTTSPPAPTPPPVTSSYRDGVVAYIYNGTPVTRAEFGEYLIARYAEKLEPFVNKSIVERACKQQGVIVESAEIDADLAEMLKTVPGDKKQFLDNMLRQKQMTLKEWKDDVIRPKLLMGKYCRSRGRVKYTEEDVAKAFESLYGEKRMVQIIIWTPDEVAKNRPSDVYSDICGSDEAFDKEARGQFDKKLAATCGQLQPFGRYSQENREMENLAFRLHEKEISPILSLFPGQDARKVGAYVMKCLKHIPADTAKKLEDVRPELERGMFDYKLKTAVAEALQELRKDADPKFQLEEHDGEKTLPPGPPEQVVATIHGNITLSREQFGEYLIDRYGADRLELFVNRLIIERAAKDKGVTITDEEIDGQLNDYIAKFAQGSKKTLVEQMLRPNKVTLCELRNDVLWPKLMLTKLCRDRVHVTDEELHQAFDAHYGKRVRIQMIMWASDQENTMRRKYALLRDQAEEFERQAKMQPSPELASKAGILEFCAHSTGNEEMERIAFKMKPGELSPVMTVPGGVIVFKCLEHLPPREDVKPEAVRVSLEKEVAEKKLQVLVMPAVVAELRKQASPILLLKGQLTEDELKRDAVRELTQPEKTIVPPHRPDAASGSN